MYEICVDISSVKLEIISHQDLSEEGLDFQHCTNTLEEFSLCFRP